MSFLNCGAIEIDILFEKINILEQENQGSKTRLEQLRRECNENKRKLAKITSILENVSGKYPKEKQS